MHIEPEKRPAILGKPVSILMPVYNEQDIIRVVLQEWIDEVMVYLPEGSELLLDDCSNDGTEKIIAEMAKVHAFLRVNTAPKDGFAKAARRLYMMAKNPLIFFTDSDGQYIPADFWTIAAALGNNDMAHGYKVGRKDPAYRVVSSYLFNLALFVLFRMYGHDINSAFRLMRREMIEDILPETRHMPMLINAEIYLRAKKRGYTIFDIPTQHRERLYGPSKSLPLQTFFWHGWKAVLGAMKLWSELRKDARQKTKW